MKEIIDARIDRRSTSMRPGDATAKDNTTTHAATIDVDRPSSRGAKEVVRLRSHWTIVGKDALGAVKRVRGMVGNVTGTITLSHRPIVIRHHVTKKRPDDDGEKISPRSVAVTALLDDDDDDDDDAVRSRARR